MIRSARIFLLHRVNFNWYDNFDVRSDGDDKQKGFYEVGGRDGADVGDGLTVDGLR